MPPMTHHPGLPRCTCRSSNWQPAADYGAWCVLTKWQVWPSFRWQCRGPHRQSICICQPGARPSASSAQQQFHAASHHQAACTAPACSAALIYTCSGNEQRIGISSIARINSQQDSEYVLAGRFTTYWLCAYACLSDRMPQTHAVLQVRGGRALPRTWKQSCTLGPRTRRQMWCGARPSATECACCCPPAPSHPPCRTFAGVCTPKRLVFAAYQAGRCCPRSFGHSTCVTLFHSKILKSRHVPLICCTDAALSPESSPLNPPQLTVQ